MLKETFRELLLVYTEDQVVIQEFWLEIENRYSEEGRYYHSLKHLEHLLQQLEEIKPLLKDWNTILFTLFYHDVIYDVLKPDNEEKSAELAEKRLSELRVPDEIIRSCAEQIHATKSHVQSVNDDTNYFTDADLSVLGQEWETYARYAANVRNEYAVYPDVLYNPGRKKVLEHFLGMDRIFKTAHFHQQYEIQARENLKREYALLAG